MKKILFLIGVGVGFLLFSSTSHIYMRQHPHPVSQKTVTIGTATVHVDVVATEVAREQGLSGRESLADGTGMLFVFEVAEERGFWMKDMQFPIDIIWADATGTIVTVAYDVATSTYPEIFYPTKPALYVLEVPAGFAKKKGIAEGDKIVLK